MSASDAPAAPNAPLPSVICLNSSSNRSSIFIPPDNAFPRRHALYIEWRHQSNALSLGCNYRTMPRNATGVLAVSAGISLPVARTGQLRDLLPVVAQGRCLLRFHPREGIKSERLFFRPRRRRGKNSESEDAAEEAASSITSVNHPARTLSKWIRVPPPNPGGFFL